MREISFCVIDENIVQKTNSLPGKTLVSSIFYNIVNAFVPNLK